MKFIVYYAFNDGKHKKGKIASIHKSLIAAKKKASKYWAFGVQEVPGYFKNIK